MWILNVLWLVLAYVAMEFVAALSHKYLMHGLLQKWHTSHHVNDLSRPTDLVKYHGLEKNDRFFFVFALPAALTMILGIAFLNWPMISVSVGITLYGATYFLIHDIVYHKRLSFPLLQRNPGRYMSAVLRAHEAHHKPKSKDDFESYGLLLFPKRFFKSQN